MKILGAIIIAGAAALALASAVYVAGLLEDDEDFGLDLDEGGAAEA